MKQYIYETHLHTSPVSKCAKANVRKNLEFYKSLGYEGVFITNHFMDGNIRCDKALPYVEKLAYYLSDYYNGLKIGKEIGLSVFLGLECSYLGTDFLVYGLDIDWLFDHPEIVELPKSAALTLMMEAGALVIQAHPFREARYIDHIRLFPRNVHGVEVFNACRTDFENSMAELYAKSYELIPFAGSDNHIAGNIPRLGGMQSDTPIVDEKDFVLRVKNGEITPFTRVLAE